ncbi:MAG: M48 family metallopeptidase [Gammaproteobacteria bacterium]|nr:M48 family metallopeptidase [Gammaproteobacteria bacterium]MBU1416695.1 M48 family metallopeptidase [Gammaproteobacteria bacterium]
MNFFEAQARARRRTGWLLVLFALAVASLVVLTNLLVMAVLAGNHGAYQFLSTSLLENFDWGLFGTATIGTLIVIGGGSAYKMSELSGGGRVVAEMLGGRLVPRNSADPAERRLLNVVEEMAIAAGTPVPPVYLLDDASINAFAAGLTSNDAVVAVTRGTLDLLNRDELQGVIAHEFSHIFNGDMRMNIRLMGVLHGILLIGLAGYYLLRSTRFIGRSRSSRGAGNIGLAMVVLGLGLVVIGYAGFFFGQWIKATVSRQREYLADASAVQFTRNRDGIGGALKKIGGTFRGSLLQSPAAREYSHAYFSAGVEGFLDSLFATHPPLERRIRRIEPRWDGKFVTPKPPQVADDDAAATRARDARRAVVATAVLAGVLTPDEAVATIGNLDRKHVDRACDILDAIPAPLRDAAAEPFGARAVIYAMLLDAAPDIRTRQQAVLATQADAAVAQLTVTLDQHLPALPEAARLPLAGLAMPTLRTLSSPQYERFRTVVAALIEADNKMSMNEWMLRHFLMRQLDEHFGLRPRTKSAHGLLGDVNREAGLVISLVAHAEHANAAEAELAFKAGVAAVGATALKFMPREQVSLKGLDEAIDRLAELKPLLKPRILKACAATIMHDGEATIRGQELLRTLASSMDSPMPPLAN